MTYDDDNSFQILQGTTTTIKTHLKDTVIWNSILLLDWVNHAKGELVSPKIALVDSYKSPKMYVRCEW